jgi:histidinol-phosphate phosphatase family protein
MGAPFVFLDKDGTLIADVPFNVEPAKIRLAANAEPALRILTENQFQIAVVSNQSGVAHGYFPESALGAVETEIRRQLFEIGVPLAAFLYCPHHPDGSVAAYACCCTCRKPGAGMLLGAARDHNADLKRSWMVGDILDDIEAGNRAGCRTILIDNGNETQWRQGDWRRPDFTVADLLAAAQIIVAQHFHSRTPAEKVRAW